MTATWAWLYVLVYCGTLRFVWNTFKESETKILSAVWQWDISGSGQQWYNVYCLQCGSGIYCVLVSSDTMYTVCSVAVRYTGFWSAVIQWSTLTGHQVYSDKQNTRCDLEIVWVYKGLTLYRLANSALAQCSRTLESSLTKSSEPQMYSRTNKYRFHFIECLL